MNLSSELQLEIHEAAERRRRWLASFNGEGPPMTNREYRLTQRAFDINTLADAYLDLIPGDDAEPLDDAFLGSVGLALTEMGSWSVLLPHRDERSAVVELYLEYDGSVFLVQGNPGDPGIDDDVIVLTSLPPVRTRGQLRQLLTALGFTTTRETQR